ncbi:hypothetical protein BU14_2220s0001 [Porphyra umbilicalis]|uniref:Uncharacterized protein n=1 Tax=Porphyra umbilicalis TaxID=2786 RepID=A0A1X6NJM9_PORUM|nr:hypothetical protein BU14_2220s0001 [Porphyra umbilicalis]|eukprot:OSX68808.1 hypothetical protein BU14_2220s0001 [Porphyra umbilicalis]
METVIKTATGLAAAVAASSLHGDALATAENTLSFPPGPQAVSIVVGAVRSGFLAFECGGAVDERRGRAAGEMVAYPVPVWAGS